MKLRVLESRQLRKASGFRGLVYLAASALVLASAPSFALSDSPREFTTLWKWSRMAEGVRRGTALGVADTQGSREILRVGSYSTDSGMRRGTFWASFRLPVGELATPQWTSLESEEAIVGIYFVDSDPPSVVVQMAETADVFDANSKRLLRSLPLPSGEVRDLVVANVDAIPGEELVAIDGENLYVISYDSGSPITTRYGFGGETLAVGQADADAPLEIAISGNTLGTYLLDGESWSVQWGFAGTRSSWISANDVDGDGLAEILISVDYAGLEAWNPRTNVRLWGREDLAVWDAEASGLVDGSIGVAFVDSNSHRLMLVDGATGGEIWSTPFQANYFNGLVVGQMDGDAEDEIVVSLNGDPRGNLLVYDTASKEPETRSAGSNPPRSNVVVEDFEGSGRRELVLPMFAQRDVDSGWVPLVFEESLRTVEESPGIGGGLVEGQPIGTSLVQIDDDPQLELCVAIVGNDGFVCIDGISHAIDYAFEFEHFEVPMAMAKGDFDGDGRAEVAVLTWDNRVYAFGGQPSGLLWNAEAHITIDQASTVLVGELDGSPGPEIFLASAYQFAVLGASNGALESGPFSVPARSAVLIPQPTQSTDVIYLGSSTGAVRRVHPQTGAVDPPLVQLPGAIQGLCAGDFNVDGELDLAIAADGEVVLFDGAAQAVTWSSGLLATTSLEYSVPLAVVDLEGDGEDDLAVTTPFGFVVLGLGPEGLFADGLEGGSTEQWSDTAP